MAISRNASSPAVSVYRRPRRRASLPVRFRARLRVEELEPRTVPSVAGPPEVSPPPSVGFLQTPNDPEFPDAGMYGLRKIQAEQAWDLTTGRPDVVVADIDSGIDYTHEDLYLNVWINQAEIPPSRLANLTDIDGDGLITFRDLNNPQNQGSGKITDQNGDERITGTDLLTPMIKDDNGNDTGLGGWADGDDQDPFTINGRSYALDDDLIGWDFLTQDNDPFDTYGHGTHTAGTIGALANNRDAEDNYVGVVGVNWAVSIMSLRFGGTSAEGFSIDGAVDAIYYAVHHGVRVSNNSWGMWGPGSFYQPLYDAVQFAGEQGHVFVAAAGNNGLNNDKSPFRTYPASFNLDNVIAVAATDANDVLASWSNYGGKSVDLGAPGVSVLSTFPGGYAYGSGTSMAAPHVTGTVALILAHARDQGQDLTVAQIKAKILNSVDPVTSLDGKTVSGGRLNAWKALTDPGTPPPSGGGGKGNGNGKGGGGGASLGFTAVRADFLDADASRRGGSLHPALLAQAETQRLVFVATDNEVPIVAELEINFQTFSGGGRLVVGGVHQGDVFATPGFLPGTVLVYNFESGWFLLLDLETGQYDLNNPFLGVDWEGQGRLVLP